MEPSLIPVFAQQMIHAPVEPSISPAAVAIPIVALLIPIVVVPTALGIRLARQKREMEHRERMRALELGRPMPGAEMDPTPVRIALKIGVGVPVSVMGIAWLASMTVHNRGMVGGAWVVAGFVGVTAVICGFVLMMKAFNLAHHVPQGALGTAHKPAFDPDAYDHVGSRG